MVIQKLKTLTIGKYAASVRSALGKNYRFAQILKHGHNKHSTVLIGHEILVSFVAAVLISLKPWLPGYIEKCKYLNTNDNK